MLTTFADDELLVGAIRAGASGYLLKSMPPDEIRSSVRAVAEGRAMLAPLLMDRLMHEYAGRRTEPAPELAKLTDRETDVLREIATGRSNGEIAARLYVSEGTVKTHVAAVLRKLGPSRPDPGRGGGVRAGAGPAARLAGKTTAKDLQGLMNRRTRTRPPA